MIDEKILIKKLGKEIEEIVDNNDIRGSELLYHFKSGEMQGLIKVMKYIDILTKGEDI